MKIGLLSLVPVKEGPLIIGVSDRRAPYHWYLWEKDTYHWCQWKKSPIFNASGKRALYILCQLVEGTTITGISKRKAPIITVFVGEGPLSLVSVGKGPPMISVSGERVLYY